MAIKSLYRDYFQKSRLFLYPALDIKRGVSVTPIQTYVSWSGKYTVNDHKLIALYHIRSDEEFKTFEQIKLFGNKLFHEFFEVEDGKGVYVFDFSEHKHNWDCFIRGGYSKMTPEHKNKVRKFFGTSHYAYIESYLYPERYMSMYADILTTNGRDHVRMLKLLKEVGELCSIADFEKEHLDVEIKSLELNQK
jgi:hypothetical protein